MASPTTPTNPNTPNEEVAYDQDYEIALLSNAVPDGLSDPFSSAQGATVDPYTGVAAGENINAFVNAFVGQDVNYYTGEAAAAGPPNDFLGGPAVDPSAGLQNTALSTDGGAAATGSPMLAFNINVGNSDQGGVPITPSNLQPPQAAQTTPGQSTQTTAAPYPTQTLPEVTTITFVDSGITITYSPTTGFEITGSISAARLSDVSPEELTTIQDLRLNIAIQEAAGPYDPNLFNTGQPKSISDVLSGADRISPGPTSAPSTIGEILSGTYADSVLRMQLSAEGQVPGSFVTPTAPNDYLFSPNATNLVEAMLFGSHSPNAPLLQAQSLELGASMAPIIGSVSTWMNPHSSWFAKALAVASVLLASELGGLGNPTELGSLSAEVDAVLAEETEEAGAITEAANLEIAEGNDLLAPGAKSGGIAANQVKGRVGNLASTVFVQEADPGAVAIGKEVEIRVNGIKTKLDNLFVGSEGNLVGVEAKFGQYAKFTPNQRAVYPSGGGWVVAIPEGPAALEAGLAEGEPVVIYLFRMRFNWPLGGP